MTENLKCPKCKSKNTDVASGDYWDTHWKCKDCGEVFRATESGDKR